MISRFVFVVAAVTVVGAAWGQDAEIKTPDSQTSANEKTETADIVAAVTPDQPRAMSGMSILGNEEAPKALVIIPWKSSELGDELGMSENLDDAAIPVDKEVFLRELEFYEIRRAE